MTIIRDSQILMLAVLKTASHSFSLIKKKKQVQKYIISVTQLHSL